MGGGDLKLLVGVGIILPPTVQTQLCAATWISIFGGLESLIYLCGKIAFGKIKQSRKAVSNKNSFSRWIDVESWRIRRLKSIPFAIAIAAGVSTYLLTNPARGF